MSTKKKAPAPKQPDYRYAIEQKVFTILYHNAKPEEVHEVRILARSRREIPLRDMAGKRVGTEVTFSYYVVKPTGFTEDLFEVQLYPSFAEAAKVFAKEFLKLL